MVVRRGNGIVPDLSVGDYTFQAVKAGLRVVLAGAVARGPLEYPSERGPNNFKPIYIFH